MAVSVKKSGPVARKTAIPPRKDEIKEPTPAEINTRRSATKRSTDRPAGSTSGENLSAASVYAAIRELQKSVYDLKTGQKSILAGQKSLQNKQQDFQSAQAALHEGQKALHSGQKQLFGQYQELHAGHKTLLERTLPVPDMPVSKEAGPATSSALPVGPMAQFQEGAPPENGLYTTPFSSLKIPLIPIRLEDLDLEPQFTDEGSVPSIPAEDRSDRVGLIEGPLPEPPPYVEPLPKVVEEPAAEEAAPETSPFQEAAFDDSAFQIAPENQQAEETDPFLTEAAHESPFTIEGPPDDPFTIADPEAAQEAQAEEKGAPFALPPQPFGAKEYTHEPCELDDPFAEALADSPAEDSPLEESAEASPFSEIPVGEELPPEEPTEGKAKSLSQQIAAAKEEQENSTFDPSQRDLLTEPEKSRLVPIMGTILALLALVGGYLFFFTDTFKPVVVEEPESVPLVEFPAYGIALPEDDPRVAEAEEVATSFLLAKSKAEVEKLILPVDANLLTDFWEPMTAPTIERLFQGRILEDDRVEVDFLINDLKGKERILPVVKSGDDPFLVDWKSFAECEDATLLGLAQGTLILDSGEEIDEGAIRSWVQSGKELAKDQDLGNFQGFKLHNFTEEVVAFAVVRKDSTEFEVLTDALSNSELKHKGKPAIRAVMRVKRIEEEDPKNKKPARLEILKVLATHWREEGSEETEEETIFELDPLPSEENSEENTSESAETSTEAEATQEEEAEGEGEAEEELIPNKLPPVPAEGDPLVNHPEESPLIRVSFD